MTIYLTSVQIFLDTFIVIQSLKAWIKNFKFCLHRWYIRFSAMWLFHVIDLPNAVELGSGAKKLVQNWSDLGKTEAKIWAKVIRFKQIWLDFDKIKTFHPHKPLFTYGYAFKPHLGYKHQTNPLIMLGVSSKSITNRT